MWSRDPAALTVGHWLAYCQWGMNIWGLNISGAKGRVDGSGKQVGPGTQGEVRGLHKGGSCRGETENPRAVGELIISLK